MTSLICGIVDLGCCGDRFARLDRMIHALGANDRSTHDAESLGPASFARIEISQASPRKAEIQHNGSGLLCGNFDLVYHRSSPASTGETGEWRPDPSTFPDLRHIDGEFAFAHWQANCLKIARDRAGTRPVFFTHMPGESFAFASFPRALIAAGFADGEHDPGLLALWSQTYSNHGARTHFQGINRVMPGHYLRLDDDGCQQHRYWDPAALAPLPDSSDYQEVTEELRSRIRRAVRRRLPRDGAVCSHLSGGLDSTSIAAVAAGEVAAEGRRVTGYTFAPDERHAAQHLVTEMPAVNDTCKAYSNIDLVALSGGFDRPNWMPAIGSEFPHSTASDDLYERVLRHAAESGATSVLSGFGGDEASSYNGRAALAHLAAAGQLWSLVRYLPRKRKNLFGLRSFLGVVDATYGLGWLRALRRRFSRKRRDVAAAMRYLRPKYILQSEPQLPQSIPNVHADQASRFCDGRLGLIAEELAWRAARHGLSYSLPLMDTDVVEYAVRIPAVFHLQGEIRRNVFRDAMEGVLPDSVRLREAKLLADPEASGNVARNRATYLSAIEDLRGTTADTIFNLDEMRESIRSLPSDEAIREMTIKEARQGRQYVPEGLHFLWPLLVARYAAQGAFDAAADWPRSGSCSK